MDCFIFKKILIIEACRVAGSVVAPDPGSTAFLTPVPEFIDLVFTKTSPKRSFSVIQNERFGLVFAKTGSIISGTGFGVGVRDGIKSGF